MTTEAVATTPDQQRHVRALAATVGMQLVEDQKAQALRGTHQLAILSTREQQFQHHVVREQDVRRMAADRLSLQALLLPRVARHAHGRLAWSIALLEEFFKLLILTVGQRVHRIDDDGLDAPSRAVAQ